MADEHDSNPLHAEQTEQTEPTSLREKAAELDRGGRREKVGYYDADELPDGSRIVRADVDGITRFQEEPVYRNEEAAYEQRQQQRQAAAQQQVEDEKQQHDQFEADWKATTSAVGTAIVTDDEKQRIGAYTQQMQELHAAAAKQAALEQRGAAEVARLNAAGQHAAAHIVANQILAGREPIQQKNAELTGIAHQWQQHAAKKALQATQLEMLRVAPELRDTDTKRAFKQWLIKEAGVPPSDIEREHQPQVVAQYFREFKKYEDQRYREIARKRIAAERAFVTRGAGSETSSKDAREQLKSRGKMDDALAYLDLRRREKRYGI